MRHVRIGNKWHKYDIVQPHANGWLFFHEILEEPKLESINGEKPQVQTDLVLAIPPAYAHALEFMRTQEAPNVSA